MHSGPRPRRGKRVMSHRLVRVLLILLALSALTTVIVASDWASVLPGSAVDPQGDDALAVAPTGSSGVEVALLSVVLGGGMVYLLRPKRRKMEK